VKQEKNAFLFSALPLFCVVCILKREGMKGKIILNGSMFILHED